MKRSLSVLLLSLAVCHLTSVSTAAQDRSRPSANLSLQIFFKQSLTPVYASVDAAGLSSYADLPRIPSWREPPGTLPLRAVTVSRLRVGEYAVVRVKVGRGEKFYETSEFVGEYRARLGETVTASELANFGVEPFSFKVVRRLKVALPEIGVANLTRSIEVVSAEVTDDKSISIQLVLRNHSPKRVVGLELHALRGGRSGSIGGPLSTRRKALIEPGGVYKYGLVFEGLGEEVAGAYVPAMPESVKVASVLFADGSYEGEVFPAARNAANLAGYKTHLANVILLIERALASPGLHTPEAVVRFRTETHGLSRDADPSVVEAVAAAYPGLDEKERASLKDLVAVGMNSVRRDVLGSLNDSERQASSGKDDKLFSEWLTARRTYFKKWLDSLTQ